MYYIGVDIGGTNIAVGIVSQEGAILHQGSISTKIGEPFEKTMASIAALAKELMESADLCEDDIAAIGIGSPGCADTKNGIVIFANNLFWRNVDVRSELRKYINKPVFVDNDANAAALAELFIGAAKQYKDVVLLTLGTGVGAGIILNGKIVGGSHHVGAEIGHMIVQVDGEPCTCGNRGCLERYTSATALIREGRKAIIEQPGSLIYAKAQGDMNKITPKLLEDCAKEGDVVAKLIYENYVKYLAMGIVSIINILDPEIIILGGGVSKAGKFLLDPLTAQVEKHIFYQQMEHASIVISDIGNQAGIVGAAMLGVVGLSE